MGQRLIFFEMSTTHIGVVKCNLAEGALRDVLGGGIYQSKKIHWR